MWEGRLGSTMNPATSWRKAGSHSSLKMPLWFCSLLPVTGSLLPDHMACSIHGAPETSFPLRLSAREESEY